MNSGIYSITCIINNKKYIGSSKDFDKSKERHFKNLKYNRSNPLLQKDYNKFGKENFIFNIEEYVQNDDNLLSEKEEFYFHKYKTLVKIYGFNYGYNIREANRGGLKFKNHKNKTKKLIKEKRKEQIFSKEFREKRSLQYSGEGNPFYGKKHCEEFCNKVRGASLEESKQIKKYLLERKLVKDIAKITGKSPKLIGKIRRGEYWCSGQLGGGYKDWLKEEI